VRGNAQRRAGFPTRDHMDDACCEMHSRSPPPIRLL
jgi:hypothetical protein